MSDPVMLLLRALGVEVPDDIDATYVTVERTGDVLAIKVNLRLKPEPEMVTITVHALDDNRPDHASHMLPTAAGPAGVPGSGRVTPPIQADTRRGAPSIGGTPPTGQQRDGAS